MKKIIAFAGSNSSTSINHALVSHLASTIENCDVTVLKLTDYPLPMYGQEIEAKEGFPDTLVSLLNMIKQADGVLISVNEHNGTISAFFKNVIDWLSRIDGSYLSGAKVILLSTSDGARGGQTALAYLTDFYTRKKVDIVASIPFPSFSENFDLKDGKIVNQQQAKIMQEAVALLIASL
ncbi:NAD(P)H-dependent oxidoreductase [Ulvibacter sp.]|jgi:chromate reductase|nr:NAD(P)H-dependent oxidoreductase [Flavobacteriaceae bacterium]MDB2631028.1 NAD(P)H-dependent oxidoreductase [Ulvibacter sp.]MDB4175217.1 NAD(P)H-dependent oxidoreductase [Flavobacteriaceae bacterium]MDC1312943.1 NAD(P)H-dependent oxidoreductase [Flavobacteriaceae bacterium]